jgi:hypothetical protein
MQEVRVEMVEQFQQKHLAVVAAEEVQVAQLVRDRLEEEVGQTQR